MFNIVSAILINYLIEYTLKIYLTQKEEEFSLRRNITLFASFKAFP